MSSDRKSDCLIIAAGKGSRLASHGEPKPLVELGGSTLIERVMATAAEAGVRSFCIVTGYLADQVEAFVPAAPALAGLAVDFVRNAEYEKENGLSVALAAGRMNERFVLLMSDHLFEARVLARLLAQPIADDEVILAVDSRVTDHPTVDLDDVTKVLVEDGAIRAIGKGLAEYNAFDTGMFLCTPALFAAIGQSARAGDCSLSGGMRLLAAHGKARVFDVGDGLWIDVDDGPAYERAGRLFARPALAAPAQ